MCYHGVKETEVILDEDANMAKLMILLFNLIYAVFVADHMPSSTTKPDFKTIRIKYFGHN